MCSASANQMGHDLLLRGGIARNPISRFRRMTQLIDEQHGRIDLARAAAFLGDHFDPASSRERGVGHTIASIASVTSVVFAPELRQVWIGLGPAPAANNRFIGFDCTPEFEASGAALSLGDLEGNAFSNDRRMRAVARYHAASLAYDENPEDADAVIALLEQAREIDPDEANYCRMLARFELRRGAPAAAERALAQAATIFGQSLAEEAENALLRGYVCDLQQRRSEAEAFYRHVLGLREETTDPLCAVNPLVLRSARKRLSKPFQEGDVEAATVSFSFQSGWE
jgi:tetratricopeptide (TPR) repeat protein